MAPNLTLHFFDPDDINGGPILEVTDEDEYFKRFRYQPELFALGGWELTLARRVGFALFDSGAVQPEVFVRFLVHAWSDTDYYGGGVLQKRDQVVVHREEQGGEEFIFGGPGPKQYMDRYRLGIEQLTGTGWNLDLENGVWRWNETATAGRVLNRIIAEDAAAADPSLPDLTKTFGDANDSDSNPWSNDVAGAGEYEIPIGQSLLTTVFDLEDLSDLYTVVNLGTVASPLYQLEAFESYGTDVGSGTFGVGVGLLREGVNIAEDSLKVVGVSLRKATHVIVEGKDGAWATAVGTAWSSGEYVKWAKIEYPRSSNVNILERAGLRWIRRQDNGDRQVTVEIVPGASEATGYYFPGPGEVLWTGNTVTLDTAEDGSTHTPLDYNNEDQLLTGIELVLGPAGDTSTADKKAKSWDVKVKLNHERGGFAGSPDQTSAASGGGGCKCITLCPASYQVIATSTAWKIDHDGTPPAGWHDAGFNDSAFDNAVANPQGGYYDGASSRWVWENTDAQAGDSAEVSFRREFQVSIAPQTARLLVAADNGAEVYVNGTLVATYGGAERGAVDASPFNYATPSTFVVDPAEFIVGTNCISIIAWNENQPVDNSGPAAVYAALTLDDVVSDGANAARCEHGHLFEDLYTNETDSGLVAAPDGSGGITWVTPSTLGLSPTPVRVPELEVHHRFIIVAHQGDINGTDGYPEGTLEAIRQAVIRGVHWIDLDLRKSSDGTWHILHDATLNRTTNLTGNISSTTDAAILAGNIDGGNGYDAGRHGTSLNVPTLIDVVNALKPYPCVFQFDCKILDDATAAELAQFAVDEGIDHRVAFNLDTDPRRAIVAAISPNIFIGGPDYGTADWDDTSFDTFAEITALAPTWFIGTVDRADYPAADEAAILETLWDRGARGIIANDIPATVAKLQELLHDSLTADISGHLANTTDAHDASAVSVLDTGGNFTATDVEAVLAELAADVAAGGLGGHYEVIVSGTAPPVAVTNVAEDDWLYGWVPD